MKFQHLMLVFLVGSIHEVLLVSIIYEIGKVYDVNAQ